MVVASSSSLVDGYRLTLGGGADRKEVGLLGPDTEGKAVLGLWAGRESSSLGLSLCCCSLC